MTKGVAVDDDLLSAIEQALNDGAKVMIVGDMPNKKDCPALENVEFISDSAILANNALPKEGLIIPLTRDHKVTRKAKEARRKCKGIILFHQAVTGNMVRRVLKRLKSS